MRNDDIPVAEIAPADANKADDVAKLVKSPTEIIESLNGTFQTGKIFAVEELLETDEAAVEILSSFCEADLKDLKDNFGVSSNGWAFDEGIDDHELDHYVAECFLKLLPPGTDFAGLAGKPRSQAFMGAIFRNFIVSQGILDRITSMSKRNGVLEALPIVASLCCTLGDLKILQELSTHLFKTDKIDPQLDVGAIVTKFKNHDADEPFRIISNPWIAACVSENHEVLGFLLEKWGNIPEADIKNFKPSFSIVAKAALICDRLSDDFKSEKNNNQVWVRRNLSKLDRENLTNFMELDFRFVRACLVPRMGKQSLVKFCKNHFGVGFNFIEFSNEVPAKLFLGMKLRFYFGSLQRKVYEKTSQSPMWASVIVLARDLSLYRFLEVNFFVDGISHLEVFEMEMRKTKQRVLLNDQNHAFVEERVAKGKSVFYVTFKSPISTAVALEASEFIEHFNRPEPNAAPMPEQPKSPTLFGFKLF